MSNTARPHAEVIKAWADGAEIEFRKTTSSEWTRINKPRFVSGFEYRVKPSERIIEAILYVALIPGMDAYIAALNAPTDRRQREMEKSPHFVRWLWSVKAKEELS